MRKILLISCMLVIPTVANAVDCPAEVNPCKVIFISPQAYQALVGTQSSTNGSVIDLAARSAGADASANIAALLQMLRAAQDGTAPKQGEIKK